MEMLRRPAVKAGMGNWIYYISTLTYEQLADYVSMPKDVYASEQDAERIQRNVDDNHVKGIIKYLEQNNERFFDAIVLAVMGGRPRWFPATFEKDGESYFSVGLLELSGDEKIFPVDGQHRLQAIKQAWKQIDNEHNEEVPVIFISHREDVTEVERLRRLFTTLNRYAKPISLADYIALDEDDIVAIATRIMTDKYDMFKKSICYNKTEAISRDNKDHFLSIISFYKCNGYLFKPFFDEHIRPSSKKSESISDFKKKRPKDQIINQFVDELASFWKVLAETNNAISDYYVATTITYQRGESGGNLLFRPRGIDPFIEAITVIKQKNKGISYKGIIEKLNSINFELNSNIWRDILWNKEILQPGQALMRDLILIMYDPYIISQSRYDTVIKSFAEKKHITSEKAIKMLGGTREVSKKMDRKK